MPLRCLCSFWARGLFWYWAGVMELLWRFSRARRLFGLFSHIIRAQSFISFIIASFSPIDSLFSQSYYTVHTENAPAQALSPIFYTSTIIFQVMPDLLQYLFWNLHSYDWPNLVQVLELFHLFFWFEFLFSTSKSIHWKLENLDHSFPLGI